MLHAVVADMTSRRPHRPIQFQRMFMMVLYIPATSFINKQIFGCPDIWHDLGGRLTANRRHGDTSIHNDSGTADAETHPLVSQSYHYIAACVALNAPTTVKLNIGDIRYEIWSQSVITDSSRLDGSNGQISGKNSRSAVLQCSSRHPPQHR